MNALKRRAAMAWIVFGAVALLVTAPLDTRAQAQKPAVDPAAVQKLKQMTAFLDGLQQFSVRTQNTIEDLHASGHRVDYDLAANVTVKRPNVCWRTRAAERGFGHLDRHGRQHYDAALRGYDSARPTKQASSAAVREVRR